MNRFRHPSFAWLLAAAVAAAAFATATFAGEEPERHSRMKLVWKADGASDRLQIEDLELAPGESRELATESGKPVTVTRDADGAGYELDMDGRKLRFGDGEAGDPGDPGEHEVRRLHRVVLGGDGSTRSFVLSDGEPRLLWLEGEGGEEGFAFQVGPGPHRLGFEPLLARIERSEKFLALDDTTREIVREVVRDAAPKWRLREPGAPGAPGEDTELELRIERRDDPAAE
jgi:hypothetical protein